MNLIKDLSEFKSASDVKSVADTAMFEHEKISVAGVINSAANTGEYRVMYNKYISKEMQELLKDNGYKVTLSRNSARSELPWIIDWSGK